MRFPSRTVAALASTAALTFWACSGASDRASAPSSPVAPSEGVARGFFASPSPLPATSPAPSPSPTPSPCPYGKGTVDTTCVRGVPVFVEKVDAAISQLVQQRPELFNLEEAAGPGATGSSTPRSTTRAW